MESAGADYGTIRIPLLGPHQLENAATAVAALETLGECLGCGFTARQVRSGLERVRWPGRCQVLSPEPLLVLDGAHNPGAGKVLADALRSIRRKPWGLVMGMCADKDARGFAAALGGAVERAWLVPVRTERAAEPEALEAAAAAAGWRAEHSTLRDAAAAARRWAGETGRGVCIAGSLFLAGEALEMAERGELWGRA
jgi:folylpolyglutamate synthase/dihydropteroate synthase